MESVGGENGRDRGTVEDIYLPTYCLTAGCFKGLFLLSTLP